MVEVWEPKKPARLDESRLRHYVALAMDADPADVGAVLSGDELVQDTGLMKLPADAWSIAEVLADEELEALVRFFTLAEMQLSGWDGGKDSPVIPLVKMLKARDAFAPELRKWIKANTDNRFLPYGAAL